MTNALPPLQQYEEEGYRTAESEVGFTVSRVVRARRNEVFRAWTDPGTFKRWIVPPGHELVSFSAVERETVWTTTGRADDACVEHVLQPQTVNSYEVFEASYYNLAVAGMMHEHPVHLLLTLKKIRSGDQSIATNCELRLSYHHATLWRHTSRVDLHMFWLDAMERLTRLVEQCSILSESAA